MKGKQAIIGIGSIILGLATSFIISPMYQSVLEKKSDIVRIKTAVTKGKQITDSDLEVVSVGTYNISNRILQKKEAVLGKYANTDIYVGSYITSDAVSDKPLEVDTYLNNIPDNKLAISVTVHSFASGLSSKLIKGDLVSVLIREKTDEADVCEIPEALKYVEVLSSTEESGYDKEQKEEVKDEKEGNKKLVTVTLLVNSEQAAALTLNEGNATMHLALVSRNNDVKKKALLEEQEEYFANQEALSANDDVEKDTEKQDNNAENHSGNESTNNNDVNAAVNNINNVNDFDKEDKKR